MLPPSEKLCVLLHLEITSSKFVSAAKQAPDKAKNNKITSNEKKRKILTVLNIMGPYLLYK
jgi:hypothetical protein